LKKAFQQENLKSLLRRGINSDLTNRSSHLLNQSRTSYAPTTPEAILRAIDDIRSKVSE
jgi:hypothetical protein